MRRRSIRAENHSIGWSVWDAPNEHVNDKMGVMALTETDVLQRTRRGLYCPDGDFFIDPSRPVNRAVITHAHADHARPGSKKYLTSEEGKAVLAHRMNRDAAIHTLPYGETKRVGGVTVSSKATIPTSELTTMNSPYIGTTMLTGPSASAR